MKKLIVVIGLPGSGKSYYLNELLDNGAVSWICEDFHANADHNSPHPADSRYIAPLVEHLQRGLLCAVADIAFCDAERLKEFEKVLREHISDIDIECRYFKNDKEDCIKNVERRARETVDTEKGLIEKFAPQYKVPRGAKTIEVYSGQ